MIDTILNMFVSLMWDIVIWVCIILLALGMLMTFFEIISGVVKQLWEA